MSATDFDACSVQVGDFSSSASPAPPSHYWPRLLSPDRFRQSVAQHQQRNGLTLHVATHQARLASSCSKNESNQRRHRSSGSEQYPCTERRWEARSGSHCDGERSDQAGDQSAFRVGRDVGRSDVSVASSSARNQTTSSVTRPSLTIR